MSARPSPTRMEDALMYLPHKGVTEYSKNTVIFDDANPSQSLHLVVQGRVKFAAPLANGRQTIVDIFNTDDFFGERCLLRSEPQSEVATALDSVSLMSWDAAEIEDQVQRQPRLGLALMQILVKRTLDYEKRIQSFALDRTPERLICALLHFADRMGAQTEDGLVRIPPLTHQLISEYVGTSREIVTFQLSHLRQNGFVRYSRQGIDVYVDALRNRLKSHAAGESA
jgi:CRP/FNR family transcriptional regulator, cyclic AMP receptor protein